MMNGQAKVGQRARAIILLGCAVLVLIGAASRVSWTRPIDAWVSTLPPEHRPVPWAELPSLYPDVPVSENAALVYTGARVRVDAEAFYPYHEWVRPEKGDPPGPSEPIPRAAFEGLVHGVNQHAKTFAMLHEAAALTRSRYPGVDLTDKYNCALSHLDHLQWLAQLEGWRIVLCAEHDDAAAAVQAAKDGLAIGRSLAGEPVFNSQLTRWECDRDILWALPRLVSRAHVTDEDLRSLGESIAALEYAEGLHRAIVADVAFSMGNWGEYSGLTEWRRRSNIFHVVGRTAVMMGFSWSNSFGLSDVEAAECAESADRIIRMSRTPVVERSDPKWGPRKHPEHTVTGTASGFQFIDWSLASFLRAERNPVTAKYVALTAIAIERYRLAKHALPAKLDDLVPAYMPQLLPDPFNGESLHYKIDGAGYRVYSVGNNGKDDDGRGHKDGTGGDDVAVWRARPAFPSTSLKPETSSVTRKGSRWRVRTVAVRAYRRRDFRRGWAGFRGGAFRLRW